MNKNYETKSHRTKLTNVPGRSGLQSNGSQDVKLTPSRKKVTLKQPTIKKVTKHTGKRQSLKGHKRISRLTKNSSRTCGKDCVQENKLKTSVSIQFLTKVSSKDNHTNHKEKKSAEASSGNGALKRVAKSDFVPISLRPSNGRMSIPIIPPNFFTHVVKHRDEYRLVIPERPHVTVRKIAHPTIANYKSTNATEGANKTHELSLDDMSTTVVILKNIKKCMRSKKNLGPLSGKSGGGQLIRIGHLRIPRGRVTTVGDVDQNGYVDLIVSSPGKNAARGSARLYLMGKNNSFLYSRDLVPGQWGFDASPLKPGDLYGSVVHALPVAGTFSMYSLVAIGAPGDLKRNRVLEGHVLNQRAHVYLLKISRKGNVLSNVRLPLHAFERLTDKYSKIYHKLQQKKDHLEDREIDVNDEFVEESKFLDAVEGVRTVIFKTKTGDVRAAIRVDDEKGQKLLRKMDQYVAATPVTRLETSHQGFPTVRVAQPLNFTQDCVFSDQECACELEGASGVERCFDFVGTRNEYGVGVCNRRSCNPAHTCTCHGSQLCRREKQNVSVLEMKGVNANGLFMCQSRRVERTLLVAVDHFNASAQSSLQQSGIDISRLPKFNDTHCLCSQGNLSTPTTKECLSYLRTMSAAAIVCEEFECDSNPEYECDWFGTEYCTHRLGTTGAYVNDGDYPNEPGHMFCHREDLSKTVVERVL